MHFTGYSSSENIACQDAELPHNYCYRKEGNVTLASIREYVEAVRRRYFGASKKEKGKILDEFIMVTGLHRKTAVRLFRSDHEPRTSKRRGRPRQYDMAIALALRVIWEATDRLCACYCTLLPARVDSRSKLTTAAT